MHEPGRLCSFHESSSDVEHVLTGADDVLGVRHGRQRKEKNQKASAHLQYLRQGGVRSCGCAYVASGDMAQIHELTSVD